MSKKAKKVNNEIHEVENVEEVKETEEMEKKGIVTRVKEFGAKVPKPVKVIGGAVLGIGAVAATGFAIFSKLNSTGYAELDSNDDACDADNIEIEDLDVTEEE